MDYKTVRETVCIICDERFTCGTSENEINNCFHSKYPLECR